MVVTGVFRYTILLMPDDSRQKVLGLISLGCPKNTVDSERLLGELAEDGWRFTDDMENASALVVNTCGFIRDARLESEEALDEICEIKKLRPDVLLVATGCLPQRSGISLKSRFPSIDLIVGVGSLPDLPRLLNDLWEDRPAISTNETGLITPARATLSASHVPRIRVTPPWTAYMKIAEGCGHECAFCTIPSIKGPHISRPVDDLVSEAEGLAADGVNEIILISQDTTAYGSDIGTNLRNLLTELDKVDDIDWIRLHYLYPSKISDSLLDVMADSSHIIPYFDIPIQHVQPGILKSMQRLAPDMDFLDLIRKIRSLFEGRANPACIRSTFIVGYPGETENDVDALLDFIESARIDRLTVFKYSQEDGTAAARLPGQVPEHEAEGRMHRLMEAQQDISLEINESWVGKNIDALIEGITDDGKRVGRTYRDAPEIDGLVILSGVPDTIEPGNFARVKVTGALPYDLEAKWLWC
jgi:ribosomal protein S12 methylthiotransferase